MKKNRQNICPGLHDQGLKSSLFAKIKPKSNPESQEGLSAFSNSIPESLESGLVRIMSKFARPEKVAGHLSEIKQSKRALRNLNQSDLAADFRGLDANEMALDLPVFKDSGKSSTVLVIGFDIQQGLSVDKGEVSVNSAHGIHLQKEKDEYFKFVASLEKKHNVYLTDYHKLRFWVTPGAEHDSAKSHIGIAHRHNELRLESLIEEVELVDPDFIIVLGRDPLTVLRMNPRINLCASLKPYFPALLNEKPMLCLPQLRSQARGYREKFIVANGKSPVNDKTSEMMADLCVEFIDNWQGIPRKIAV